MATRKTVVDSLAVGAEVMSLASTTPAAQAAKRARNLTSFIGVDRRYLIVVFRGWLEAKELDRPVTGIASWAQGATKLVGLAEVDPQIALIRQPNGY